MITSKYLKMQLLWLLVMAVLPMKAARQTYTVTSTITGLSGSTISTSETGYGWTTTAPKSLSFSRDTGLLHISADGLAQVGQESSRPNLTSSFTVTGTLKSLKLTAYGSILVKVKVGGTNIGELTIGGKTSGNGGTQKYEIPITETDVTDQAVTLEFYGTQTMQYSGYLYLDKIEISYLEPKKAAGLSFSSQTASMTVGETKTPQTLTNPNQLGVTWSSSNTAVATVSNTGAVTALKDGTTNITASFAGNDEFLAGSAAYGLIVNAPTLSAPTFSLAAGTYDAAQSLTLSTTKQGADIYYSIDNGAAQKYTGAITISQSCTVSAYTQYMGYKSATDSRQYVIRQAASLSFSAATASVTLGESFTPPTLNNPSSLSLTWSSSNTGVATVSNTGAVTIVGTGTTKITASFAGDATRLPASASYTLTVSAPSLSAPSFSLPSGTYDGSQSLTLSTSKQGADIYYSIDNGAAQKYTGAITISQSCTVSAYTQYMGYKSATDSRQYVIRQDPELSFLSSECTIIFGDDFTPPYLSNKYNVPVKYSSSDPTVAQVNASGEVDVKKVGKTTITATFSGDAIYFPDQDSYDLIVNAPGLSAPSFSLPSGTYDGSQILTLSTSKQGADIYYSIDNGTAQKYTGAITISQSCTVSAYIQYMGYKSATDSRQYVIRQDPELSFLSSECTVILGDEFTPPYLSNKYNVPVTYSSSDPTVAQVNATGQVDLKTEGTTTITATFSGDANYLPDQANYDLIVLHRVDSVEVAGAYKLWVNGIRVTEKNRLDILGDGKDKEIPSVMFDGKQTLVLSNAKLDSIVTQLSKDLTLYIQGDNTVKSNNTPAVHQTAEQRVTFKLTTSGNYPGTLTLASPVAATDGFIRTTLEQQISVLKETADETMYGTVLFPFTYSVTITFPPSDFLDSDGNEIDLSNQVVNNILFTLRSANEDGYDEEQQAIIMNTPMSRDVYSPNPVGSGLYAEQFCGMTFMIPAGKGEIIIDNFAKDGYLLGVKVGSKSTVLFQNSSWTKSTINYNVSEPTYVRLFNAGTGSLARQRGGKKTTTRIGIRSIVIKPQQIAASNEVQSVIPQATTIDTNPVINTGITEVLTAQPIVKDGWYNLNGQRLNAPLRQGIYVRRGRKVIIK